MAYLTPAEFVLRYDARRVAELLTTDVSSPVEVIDLPGNSSLQALLDDASGQIDAAVTVGHKYTPDDLTNMTGTAKAFLKRLTADLTWALVLSFKGLGEADLAQQAPRYKDAQRILEELANGSMVFGIELSRDAGLPSAVASPNSDYTLTKYNKLFGTYPYGSY